jgi:hypothetical protein
MEAIARARDKAPDNSYSQQPQRPRQRSSQCPDNPDGIIYSSSSDDSANEGVDEGVDEALDNPLDKIASQPAADIIATLPPLNPTQAVVIALVSHMLEGIYHIIVDNLFSSPDLFKALRILGVGAIGNCRTNCGLYRHIANLKEIDRKGQLQWDLGPARGMAHARQ